MRNTEILTDYTDSDNESDEKHNKTGIQRRSVKKSKKIVPRPNASPGYWLCCLLPLALCTHYLPNSGTERTECTSTYTILTLAAIGMCVESLCFFAYIHVESWLLLKLLISLAPSFLTSALFKYTLSLSWGYGVLWGFVVTFCYQNVYVRIMRGLPQCFSYGEAAVLVEGLMIFVLNAALHSSDVIFKPDPLKDDFAVLNVIMMSALFFLLVTCTLLGLFRFLRKPFCFYPLMGVLLIVVTCAPVTHPLPVIALFEFLFEDENRLKFIGFCLLLTLATVATIWCQLSDKQKASTRVRKIFHALIVLVYIPGLICQCALLYIASGVALAIFTVLELFRILNIPPLADGLKEAFATFSDEKDSGILALTPFSLLIGCSLPIWISPCPCDKSNQTNIALLAGILSTGIGDAAASIIGSKFGRIKWRNTSRSLEGSAAFVLSVAFAAFGISIMGYIPMTLSRWCITLLSTLITALIEAHTDQIDNLVLPLIFYTIVNLV